MGLLEAICRGLAGMRICRIDLGISEMGLRLNIGRHPRVASFKEKRWKSEFRPSEAVSGYGPSTKLVWFWAGL